MAKSIHVGGGMFRSAGDPAVYTVPQSWVRRKRCQKGRRNMEQGWGAAWLEECRKFWATPPLAWHKLVKTLHTCNPGTGKRRQGCQIIPCYVAS